MNFKEGEVLYFDKPLTWTSFAVVNKIRYHLCRRMGVKKLKVGHAGTLDPLATGVMIICTGKATKRIEEFQYHTKEYVATLMLGATTPSYDLEKEIDATYPTEHITKELVKETLKKFIGSIEQIPPAFSACMVDGKRAYELARHQKSGRMLERHIHPGPGTRQRRSTTKWSTLNRIDTHPRRRCPPRKLHENRRF